MNTRIAMLIAAIAAACQPAQAVVIARPVIVSRPVTISRPPPPPPAPAAKVVSVKPGAARAPAEPVAPAAVPHPIVTVLPLHSRCDREKKEDCK